MSRPLILLDVDGPLNPYSAKPHCCPEGYVTHRIRPTDWGGAVLRVWLNPAHGPRLLKLAADSDAELAWATTWQQDANLFIGPHIGLPELPVIYFDWSDSANRYQWKWSQVAQYAVGRPLIWFDDDFAMESHHGYDEFVIARAGIPTFLRLVSPRLGLTDADFQAAKLWLADRLDRSTLIPGSGRGGPIRDTENGETHGRGADPLS